MSFDKYLSNYLFVDNLIAIIVVYDCSVCVFYPSFLLFLSLRGHQNYLCIFCYEYYFKINKLTTTVYKMLFLQSVKNEFSEFNHVLER